MLLPYYQSLSTITFIIFSIAFDPTFCAVRWDSRVAVAEVTTGWPLTRPPWDFPRPPAPGPGLGEGGGSGGIPREFPGRIRQRSGSIP